ncbi:hypothetical protein [Francisella adeliensis]|uniref:Uncharacterized protein n=1 Tax=Francisella adeliensis TaxID=2007306 RepID=A0A2Z4XX55_9GAMM|nr:hypothetical protein [Francisella adeliensis]AXA32985.1 hypothetical protein CDH04_00505 [Francisella adeliensis]MBK2086130.1 hypothetical protein [Francisella adeliensis]MBK2096706.1 hypothetical protein [Francisella adeliensis]QIW11211.1 hypothetical protein FZC43_00505 [Francisella adeliensis]QIW13087.1 hypothetical protein FZC44_00505 [Francisella adeliensis]
METLELLSWQDVKNDVMAYNAAFADVINKLDPPKDFKLVRARYKYGDEIFKKGILHLRYKGKLIPFSSREIPSEYTKELSYALTPLGMSLNKNLEMFITHDDSVVPISVFKAGQLFGVWNILSNNDSLHYQYRNSRTITAGNKSNYILPKISDTRSFNRLKKEFKLNLAKPSESHCQLELFKAMDRTQPKNEWYAEVIFFSKDWFDECNELKTQELKLHIYELGWQEMSFLREKVAFNFNLSNILTTSNLKPNPYVTDIVHHLYAIRRGFYPGFAVATEDSAPINFLEQAFVDVYKITSTPVFLSARHLAKETEHDHLYYLFNFPTLMEFSPKSRLASKVTDILELQYILEKTISYVLSLEPGNSFESIEEWFLSTEHKFYHTHQIENNESLSYTDQLMKDDSEMLKYYKKYPRLPFCSNATLLRGCAKITAI